MQIIQVFSVGVFLIKKRENVFPDKDMGRGREKKDPVRKNAEGITSKSPDCPEGDRGAAVSKEEPDG